MRRIKSKQLAPTDRKTKAVRLTNLDKRQIKFIESMALTMGHITNSCRASGITRQTYYNWIDKNPDFAVALENTEWEFQDDTENVLRQKIADGELGAITFSLTKTHPKYRSESQPKVQVNILNKLNEQKEIYQD